MELKASSSGLATLTAIAAAAFAIAGCSRGASDAKHVATDDAARTAASADQARGKLEHSTTAGVRMDHNRGPVEMRFALTDAPVAGEPFTVTVSIVASESAATLKVDVATVDGLELHPPTVPLVYDKVEPGMVYTIPLEFVGNEAGIRVVTLTASEPSPSGTDSATFSFPVIVGAAPAAQADAPGGAPAAPVAAPAPAQAPAQAQAQAKTKP